MFVAVDTVAQMMLSRMGGRGGGDKKDNLFAFRLFSPCVCVRVQESDRERDIVTRC